VVVKDLVVEGSWCGSGSGHCVGEVTKTERMVVRLMFSGCRRMRTVRSEIWSVFVSRE
jgi:hypothetical protein